MRNFASSVAGAALKVVKFGAVMTAAAVTAVAFFVRQQLLAIDSTAKMADALGLTTEKLTALHLASNLAGISNEELEKGVTRLQKTVSDAGNGLTTAKRALDKLGLSADQLRAMSPDQQLKVVAERFSQLTNQTDRAGVAMDIFGRSGLKMANLLDGGAAAIERAEKETQVFGSALSRVDAKKVEMANDAFRRLKEVFTGVVRQLTVQLAPFLELVATRLTLAASSGEGMGSRVQRAFDFVVLSVARVVDYVDLVIGAFQKLASLAAAALAPVLDAVGWLVQGLEFAVEKLLGISTNIGDGMVALARQITTASKAMSKDADRRFDSFFAQGRVKQAESFMAKVRADAEKAAQAAVDMRKTMGLGLIDDDGGVMAKDETTLPRLLRAGSAEAISFVNQQRFGEKNDKGLDALNETGKQQLTEQKNGNRLLDRIAGRANNDVAVAF